MDDTNVPDPEEGEVRVTYCPACDREVRIKVPEGSQSGASDQAAGAGAIQLTGICLDVGEDCTGAFCPFGEQPEV